MDYDWIRMPVHVVESFEVQSLTDLAFVGWISMLILANQSVPPGRIPDEPDIPELLGMGFVEAKSVMDELMEAGLLIVVNGVVVPKDWHLYDPRVPYNEG